MLVDADDTRASFSGRAKSHWADIVEHAHERIAPALGKRKTEHLASVLDRFEAELAPVLAAFHADTLAHVDLPDAARALLDKITNPEHFTESLLIGVAVGATIYPILGAMTAPTSQDIANEVWSHNPTVPLTPSELASAALKGIDVPGGRVHEAALSGMNEDRYGALVEIAGNAIGFQEALLLERRGQLEGVTLDDVLGYSNVNKRFYASAKNLLYNSPSVGAVLSGAVQGHLDDEPAKNLYREAGGNPDNYDWQYEATGRPPGAEQMLHLLNRKLMTEPEVRLAIRESDIKNKYIDAILASRVYLPPPRSVVPQLRHGSIDVATARQFLDDYGVTPTAQDAFIKEASTARTVAHREASAAQIIAAYEEHLFTRPEAVARLVTMHYDDADAQLLLDLADKRIEDAHARAVVSRARALYTAHKIGKPVATTAVGEVGITGAQQVALFKVWDVERTAAAPNLTVAQWQGALRRGLITHADFDAAMERFGYSTDETDLLAGLAFPPPKAPKAPASRDLTVSQLVRLYQAGTITAVELTTRLTALGYSAEEAAEIISLSPPPEP